MQLDPDSLERLVPDEVERDGVTGAETLRLHVERYEFAAGQVGGGRLLDAACGVGYGTRILTGKAPVDEALGVDVSEAAIAYAREHYADARTHYRRQDAMTLEDEQGFDAVVSIETIEHLPEPAAFIDRMAGLLRPGGRFVASVPITPSVDANPHHLHDFSERSFRRHFERNGLVACAELRQDQPFSAVAVATRSEARLQHVRSNLPLYYARHPGKLLLRVGSTLRHGFRNKYLTVAWQRPA